MICFTAKWGKYYYKLVLLFLAAHNFVINHPFFFKVIFSQLSKSYIVIVDIFKNKEINKEIKITATYH